MVANETLKIAPVDGGWQPVYLAPFGEEELAQVLPLGLQDMPYLPLGAREIYAKGAESILASEAEVDRAESWGIYPGSIAPAHFAGTVSLGEVNYGTEEEPRFSKVIQEVGTFIMSQDQRGKNLGTIAKLAVITHALETQNTHAFQAWTSECNTGVQKSLGKTGFTHLETHQYQKFPGGEGSQFWILADPAAQPIYGGSYSPGDLHDGWQRYDAFRRNITVKKG